MSKAIDLTGRRFDRILVLGLSGRDRWGMLRWRCLCDCGTEFVVSGDNLKRGNTRSCGCIRRELARVNSPGNKRRVPVTVIQPDGFSIPFYSLTEAGRYYRCDPSTVASHARSGIPFRGDTIIIAEE